MSEFHFLPDTSMLQCVQFLLYTDTFCSLPSTTPNNFIKQSSLQKTDVGKPNIKL